MVYLPKEQHINLALRIFSKYNFKEIRITINREQLYEIVFKIGSAETCIFTESPTSHFQIGTASQFSAHWTLV